MDDPLVSICIPMYNSEKTIARTLQSLIAQTYQNLEIIVVDNCSTDNSVYIVNSFKDPRIHVIQYNIHLPVAELNWNRCFPYVKGTYMAIFHADDVYLPDMVRRQVETFRNNPSVVGVFTSGNIINERDGIIGEFKLPGEIQSGQPYTYSELLNLFLVHADFLPTPSAMVLREIYKNCAPFRYDQFKSAADLDIWLRAAVFGTLVILDEKLFNYRISKSQGSNTLFQLRTKEADYFKVMDQHLIQNNVSERARVSYGLSRFGDQMICQKNFLKKHFIYLLLHPELLFEKIRMYRYFKIFKA